MNLIQQLEQEEAVRVLGDKKIPEFSPGDTLTVNVCFRDSSGSPYLSMRCSAVLCCLCRAVAVSSQDLISCSDISSFESASRFELNS